MEVPEGMLRGVRVAQNRQEPKRRPTGPASEVEATADRRVRVQSYGRAHPTAHRVSLCGCPAGAGLAQGQQRGLAAACLVLLGFLLTPSCCLTHTCRKAFGLHPFPGPVY